MSTRGAIGFYKNDSEKVGYNHFDSYPTGLGNDLIKFLKGKTVEDLNTICDSIALTDEDGKDAVEFLPGGEMSFNSFIEDYKSFLYDSLFCEYAYIINLDDNIVEFYKGFNKSPEGEGRYASTTVDDGKRYYGVVLKQKIPLEKFIEGKVTADDEKGFVVEKNNGI